MLTETSAVCRTKASIARIGFASIVLMIAAVLSAADVSAAPSCGQPKTYSWTGTHSTAWSDAQNWSPIGMPGSCDIADVGVLPAAQVSGAEVLELDLSGGEIDGSALQVDSAFAWTGGTVALSLTVPTGGVISISGGGTLDGGTINNAGSATWTGTGDILGSNQAVFNNIGTFIATNNRAFDSAPGLSTATFNNVGTFRKSISGGVTSFVAWNFNNAGTLDIQTGVLNLGYSGNLVHTFLAGGTFSGLGRTRVSDLTRTAPITVTGQQNIASGGAIELSDGGAMSGNGSFAGAGALEWSGGTINNNGIFTMTANTTLSITGTSDKTLSNATLTNDGTAIWTGNGSLLGSDGAIFNNRHTFNVLNNAAFDSAPGDATATFNNTGSFTKSSSGTTTSSGWDFQNHNTFDIGAGILNLGYAGNLEHGFHNAAKFVGAGRTRISGALNTAPIDITGTLIITGGATLELSSQARLKGQAILTGNGTFNWSGGSIEGGADITITTGTTLSISGALDKSFSAATLNNAGTARWTGPGSIRGSDDAVFNNTGTFDVQNDALMGVGSGTSHWTFNNVGTFTKATGLATTIDVPEFVNSGIVSLVSARLDFAQGYRQTAGNTFLVAGNLMGEHPIQIDGGTLSGLGTITGTVSNAGTLSPGFSAGAISIAGDYIQAPTGTLSIEIGGLIPGALFDQLNITGQAQLNGKLKVTLIQYFVPSLGDSFRIMSFGSRSGNFATKEGMLINRDRWFTASYDATQLTLTVVKARLAFLPLVNKAP
jgi:hypothetical protein